MVYINLRINVADYDKWRAGFDVNESSRKSAGSTGVNQFYRDVDNPNNVTLILEWNEADKAQAFLNDPHTKASMDEAGVTGRPMVVAVQRKV
jgi:quinol monooxygenase YgiN